MVVDLVVVSGVVAGVVVVVDLGVVVVVVPGVVSGVVVVVDPGVISCVVLGIDVVPGVVSIVVPGVVSFNNGGAVFMSVFILVPFPLSYIRKKKSSQSTIIPITIVVIRFIALSFVFSGTIITFSSIV